MSMKTVHLKHKPINKPRAATRKPRDTGDVAENMDGRRRSGFEGSSKARARRSNGIGAVIDDSKFSKEKHGGRWNSKSSMKKTKPYFAGKRHQEEQEGKNESTSLASGYKRKRVYAEREEGPHGRGAVEWSDAKHGSNPKRNKFSKEKHGGRWNSKSGMKKTKPYFAGKRYQDEQEGKNESTSLASGYKRKRVYAEREEGPHGRGAVEWSDAKHRSNPKRDETQGSQKNDGQRNNSLKKISKSEFKLSNHHGRETVECSHSKHRNNSKMVDLRSSHKNDDERNDSLKKFSKNMRESGKEYGPSQKKPADASILKVSKKAAQGKKQLDGDSDAVDNKPKSRKKVFRMVPNDVSNKRLDDIGVDNDKTQEIKEDLEKKKMSLNAQFRAIKPSPSILSFVEDNLLGRRRMIDLRRSGYNIDLSAPLDNTPFSTSSERQRIEEPIFRNKLTFFAAAKISSSFPPAKLPEIAFAGRSNVGKSSLLNALTRQWGVVRTSDKPGLTQTINFFDLEKKLCLVDLPGYGFAYAKEEVKDSWEELVKEYVSTRIGLNRVCLLIDTKWGMKQRDHELINLMERSRTQYQIVLTKTDTVFPIDVARRAMQIEESLKQHKSVVHPAMMVSSKSGAGIGSLRKVLSKIARMVKV